MSRCGHPGAGTWGGNRGGNRGGIGGRYPGAEIPWQAKSAPCLHDAMVFPDRLPVFAALSFLPVAVPGPGVLVVAGRALARGRRAALGTVVSSSPSSPSSGRRPPPASSVPGSGRGANAAPRAPRSPSAPGRTPEGGAPAGRGSAVGVTDPETPVFRAAVPPRFADRAGAGRPRGCRRTFRYSTSSRWPATACGPAGRAVWPRQGSVSGRPRPGVRTGRSLHRGTPASRPRTDEQGTHE